MTTREPGGTVGAEVIRKLLLRTLELRIDGVGELLLLSAGRRIHAAEVIRPALESGQVVICDRFELSSRAYQGFGRGVSQSTVESATEMAIGDLRPDVYIVLDVPDDETAARMRERGAPLDRIERERSAFRTRVRDGYRTLASADSSIEIVDGSGTPDEVETRVLRVLEERFPETFPPRCGINARAADAPSLEGQNAQHYPRLVPTEEPRLT